MAIKTIKNLSTKMFVFGYKAKGSKEKFRLAPASGVVAFPAGADETYAQALAKAGKVEIVKATTTKATTTKATDSETSSEE